MTSPYYSVYGSPEIDAIVEKAVLSERERCAKIAEGWHPMLYAPEMGGAHQRDAGYTIAKECIAKAIRDVSIKSTEKP